jgi:error-prone DNA polymerase
MKATYVELHCHSYFSFRDGAPSPESLVERAAELGYPALALTDHDGLYGAVVFWQAAREKGIRPIIGAEITLEEAGPTRPQPGRGQQERTGHHLTLLAETQQGYANLCRLISAGQLAGQKGQPRLTLATLADHAAGLLCLSGCRQGAISAALLANDPEGALATASDLRQIFGPDRFWIELQSHYLPTDGRLVAELVELARRLDVGIVATNNVHHATRSRQRLHDVLTCIRHLTTLPEALAAGLLFPNSERFLKSPTEMAVLFAGLPEALRNTCAIAERCLVDLDFSGQRLPTYPVPAGQTLEGALRALCEEGLRRKFDPITPQARAQMEHELVVIGRAGLAGYFLVVWDIVRFARSQSIRCQGRGSAANSLVAYLLDITPVDPLRHNLLFERFLSEGTHTTPDIDVDFAADRREEVIQYVYERYGEEHVAMVCNVVTYRARSAVRDVAKVLAFPPDVVDRVAKALDTHSAARAAGALHSSTDQSPSSGFPSSSSTFSGFPSDAAVSSVPPDLSASLRSYASSDSSFPSFLWQTLCELLQEIDGLPRHLSIHVGGMLITAAPLVEVVPVERATMPGRVVVQWNKDSVEDAGLIKIDLLSLGTLGMVEEALQHIRTQRGIDLDLEHLPLDRPEVYDMLQRADTVGTFQVESRAQSQMLPRLKPRRFEDIIIEVALVRPGPIQGNMVHPYLKRRDGLEPVTYAHPALEPALSETLGVIIFQEQVIRVAMSVAAFSPAEADQLRRAMSRSRSPEAMAALQGRFVQGALANGVDKETAEEIFRQLAGFAGFGFCKSHAAAFALVGYQTLYLKAHYAAEFFCALLNNQPMGFYAPEVLVGDARRHGVPVYHPDINVSQDKCTLEPAEAADAPETGRTQDETEVGRRPLAIRLGLRYVHGLGEAWRGRIIEQRGESSFDSLRDLCRRTLLPRDVVENLIRSGSLDSLGQTRRDLLWELGGLDYREQGLDIELVVEPVTLPTLHEKERLGWEYELLGMAPGDHIMRLYRDRLRKEGVLRSKELEERRDGEIVKVAGMVAVRQRPPTAKGHVFITLEDEDGLINLIIRPQVYERHRDTLRNRPLLLVAGRLQREGQAMSVLVQSAAGIR